MSVYAEYQKEMQRLASISNIKNELSNKIQMLMDQRRDVTDIKESLNLDHEIYTQQRQLDNLENDTMCKYLLKVNYLFTNQHNKPTQSTKTHGLHLFFNTINSCNNKEWYSKYIKEMHGEHTITKQEEDIFCTRCQQPFVVNEQNATQVCTKCGNLTTFIDNGPSSLTFDEQQNMVVSSTFCYKREHHFKNILNQVQSQQVAVVPEYVITEVASEIKKQRIDAQITGKIVKSILKKIKLGKYYEHCSHIATQLGGVKAPTINSNVYDQLIKMFSQIQSPFEKICPQSRKNFFNYNFIIYKFCELLHENELKQFFPLMKSVIKIKEQDVMWKRVCNILHWKFMPTR